MDGWMDGCIRMDGCMHACMYVWSRVPCSRERELGGPYHRGGARDPESGLIYIYIIRIYTYEYIWYMRFKKNKNNHVKSQFWISEISPWIGPVTCWDAPAQSVTQKWGCSLTGVPSRHQTAANVHPDLVLKWMCCGYSDRADLYLCYLSISTQGCSCTLSTGCRQGYHISQVDISFSIQPSLYPQL